MNCAATRPVSTYCGTLHDILSTLNHMHYYTCYHHELELVVAFRYQPDQCSRLEIRRADSRRFRGFTRHLYRHLLYRSTPLHPNQRPVLSNIPASDIPRPTKGADETSRSGLVELDQASVVYLKLRIRAKVRSRCILLPSLSSDAP